MKVFLGTARAFVDQQQFIFDMLWHKTVPAKQRIKEIEQGLKGEFIVLLIMTMRSLIQ